MSDTPRTDVNRYDVDTYAGEYLSTKAKDGKWIPWSFANQLERELNAANAEIERLKNQPREIICTKCGLREEHGEKLKAKF